MFLEKQLTLTVPSSTKEYNWILMNCQGNADEMLEGDLVMD